MYDPATPEALRVIAKAMREPLYQTDMHGIEALVLDNAANEIEELYDLIKRIYMACMHEEGSGVVGFTGEVHMSQELFDDIFEAVNAAIYHTGSMWPKGHKNEI